MSKSGNHQIATAHNPHELPEWFKGLPAGRQMLEEFQEERDKRRSALLEELRVAQNEYREACGPLDDAIHKTEAAVKAIEERLSTAREDLNKVKADRYRATAKLDGIRRRVECLLRSSAPVCIDEFAKESDLELAALRNAPITSNSFPTGDRTFDGRIEKEVFSRLPSIEARILGLIRILQSIDQLRVNFATEAAIRQEIAKLRAGLPEIKSELVQTVLEG